MACMSRACMAAHRCCYIFILLVYTKDDFILDTAIDQSIFDQTNLKNLGENHPSALSIFGACSTFGLGVVSVQ